MMRATILLLILCAMPVIAQSAVIEVPKDYTTIQAAIDAAVKGDTVLVAPGTYVENIDFKGKAITVKSRAGAPVIDGNRIGTGCTFSQNEGFDSVLDGFYITNGGTIAPDGGGICCINSSPTIKNNIISGNMLMPGGAGIYCFKSSPKILNNTITDNFGAYDGGGIWCVESSPDIINNMISKNRTGFNMGGYGGGIQCSYNSSPNIMNNTISMNTAEVIDEGLGGGIYCDNTSSPTITGNTIWANISEGSGGGIYCRGSSTIITNNTILSNTSERSGGGILCKGSSTIIANNLINANTANTTIAYEGKGGGIYCSGSSTIITNNTIAGNNASSYGGGIYCDYSSPNITNTIIWENTSLLNNEICGIASLTYCNVKGGYFGAGNINSDPLFVVGLKGGHYLSQTAAGQSIDSPCLDTGNDLASNLEMDIYWTRTDGVPDSGTVDMGYHHGDFIFPSLQTDTFNISASTGGTANYLLLGDTANANRDYLILGSVSGTNPGLLLPGAKSILPLNWDLFTNLVLSNINTPFFNGFMGKLDSAGSSAAVLNTFGPITPVAVGNTLYFAYALNGPWNFASNPVSIEIVP